MITKLTRVIGLPILLFINGSMIYGASQKKPQILPSPTEASSLETLSRGAMGLGRFANKVLILPKRHVAGTLAFFDDTGKTREKIFGSYESLEKPKFMREQDQGNFVQVMGQEGGNFMVFDGKHLAWVELDPHLKELMRRSVPWDLIRPPRDSGGEPTKPEIAEMRQRFYRHWQATNGLKSSGIAKVPLGWGLDGKRDYYLAALRVQDFPMVLMDCDPKEPSQCQLTRGCFVEGGAINPSSVAGLAISARRKLILVGDSGNGKILAYRFHSCFHVTYETSWILPSSLKKLSNVMVDQDDRLWVTTEEPDDYLNASVFYWTSELW